MTASRFLPLLNLAGCLLITGVIVAQGVNERSLREKIKSLGRELVISHALTATAVERADALGNDINQLKESIAATARARKETEDAMATAMLTNLEQLKIWENAIAGRDEKIRVLNASLTTSRERLDEAISKLKAAGAR